MMRTMMAVALIGLAASAPVEARGRHAHGFHGHRGVGRTHVHCHSYRDAEGRHERVCV